MNETNVAYARKQVESDKGNYNDLAVMGEYYFARLQELAMAIEDAGKSGDPKHLTEGLGNTAKNISGEMASIFGHEADRDKSSSDTKSSIQGSGKQVKHLDMTEIMAIVCELHETSYFFADTSSLFKHEQLIFDIDSQRGIVTPHFMSQLAQAQNAMACRHMELLCMLETELGEHVSFPTHQSKIKLFDYPKKRLSDYGLVSSKAG